MTDAIGNDPRRLLAAIKPPAPEKQAKAPKPDPIVRPAKEPKPPRAAKPPREPKHAREPKAARDFGRTGWIGLMAMGAAAVIVSGWLAWREAAMLTQAASNPTAVKDEWTQSGSPDFLEVMAEQALRLPKPDEAMAYLAAKRAVDLDPTRAFAWATLAYLEAKRSNGVNEEVVDALMKSMTACPLCDQALIRWRMNFVLSNWEDIPDDLRRKAFEHADLLRWMGDNAEFLAEMRFKARLHGIPFDAYRAAVNTPARSWDIAPAAQLRGTRAPAG